MDKKKLKKAATVFFGVFTIGVMISVLRNTTNISDIALLIICMVQTIQSTIDKIQKIQ